MAYITEAFEKEYDEINVILDADKTSATEIHSQLPVDKSFWENEETKFDEHMVKQHKILKKKHISMLVAYEEAMRTLIDKELSRLDNLLTIRQI